ncbi:hypothetical protein EVG20_g966 [Dentipellis fragilis]|uniref:Uncharacterized protein n=1 Tax=Dentipellis fragilis TaxID=205917 RepID=A0A4Y9ZE50_9AGAM|nr:hypothetical protein EVG20_g966 [Dentipellis fragilis]
MNIGGGGGGGGGAGAGGEDDGTLCGVYEAKSSEMYPGRHATCHSPYVARLIKDGDGDGLADADGVDGDGDESEDGDEEAEAEMYFVSCQIDPGAASDAGEAKFEFGFELAACESDVTCTLGHGHAHEAADTDHREQGKRERAAGISSGLGARGSEGVPLPACCVPAWPMLAQGGTRTRRARWSYLSCHAMPCHAMPRPGKYG